MKSKELDAVIAALKRILQSSGLEPAHRKRLRTMLREAIALKKGGKIVGRRVVRYVALASEIACNALARDGAPEDAKEQR